MHCYRMRRRAATGHCVRATGKENRGGHPLRRGAAEGGSLHQDGNPDLQSTERRHGSSLYGENAYWGVINIVTLSGDDIAGSDAQLYGGSRTTESGNVQYGTRLRGGAILADVRLLQSMFPMEFWIDDRSKFRASDIFLKGSWKDLVAEVYRHDDRLDGFAEPFPTVAQPSRQFASAHALKQTVDIIAVKYNHAPQDARVTFAADASWSHRSGMLCAGCHAAQEQPQFSNPQNHGYQAIGDFRSGL